MTIAEAVARYLALAAEVRSHRTLPMLRSDLAELERCLARQGVREIADLRRAHLHTWLAHLKRRRLAASTIGRKVSHARGWCDFLAALGWTAENVGTWLRLPASQPGHRPPAGLDVDALLAACAGDDALSLRDQALVEILYATGMRACEVALLRVGDVALDDARVVVLGRRAGQQVLPLHGAAVRALRRYLASARPGAAPGEPLFLSRRGTPLRERDVRARLRVLGRRAGVARATPDMLRRQLAVTLVERGADVRAVAQLLGHARLSTTRRALARRPAR
jgi:site-specific recombinase XerD